MYRYREDSGVTDKSIAAAEKHIHKIGQIHRIRGYVYRGRYGVCHVGTMFYGEHGTVRLSGLGWGYGGTGPRGMKTVLDMLSVPKRLVDHIMAIEWPSFSKPKECWDVRLPTVSRVPTVLL